MRKIVLDIIDTILLVGHDGVQLYTTTKLVQLDAPLHDVASRGTVTALVWLTDPAGGDPLETLCFGTQRGWLAVWQQTKTKVRAVWY